MTIASLLASLNNLFFWTVPFLVVLGVVIVVHELGHFLAARALGVTVETFSVGFGREIFGFFDSRGTRWRLAWIPLGGYVKFKGDESVASMPSRERLETLTPDQRAGNFHTAPVWRRALIVVAGPMANFLLCIVVLTGWFMATGISYREALITCVEPGMPGETAGLKAGDKVLAVSGNEVKGFEDFRRLIVLNARSAVDLTVERAGRPVTLQAVPELTKGECVGQLGVTGSSRAEDVRFERLGLSGAFSQSVDKTWINITLPFQFLGQLFRGNACASQLGGPIKIAEASKQMASASLLNLIPLIAFISVSVGILNLFPIPVLDGGHLLFYGAEAILGRPLSQKAQEIGFQIGFVSLLMLMAFVTWNNIADLAREAPPASATKMVCRS